jgi:PAS domain S-box-containing protein
MNILDVISGADPNLLSTIWNTLENDRFVLIQAFCARQDESIFPAEISVNRLNLSTQVYLSFFIRDITRRKAAEEQLRTGYNALHNSSSGILITNIDACITYTNPAFLSLYDCDDPDEVLDKHISELLGDGRRTDAIIDTILNGESWIEEVAMRRSDGTNVFVQLAAAANLNPDGEIAGMVLSLTDITERVTAQQQLEAYAEELRINNNAMQDDLTMARDIQRAFLPQKYPTFGKENEPSAVDFAHLYIPSGAVGGDFFDIIKISDHQVGLFISDVMGHGMRAALVVATIRGLIEQLSGIAAKPAEFMTAINDAYTAVFRQLRELTFATALYVVLDTDTGKITYATAGHPRPYWLRPSENNVKLIPFSEGATGPALGLTEIQSNYKQDECQLDAGDVLLLYTDGICETEGPDREDYETMRMKETLQANLDSKLQALLETLVSDAQQFSSSIEFKDDVCMVCMRYNG